MRAYVVRIVPAAPGALERPEQLSVSLMIMLKDAPNEPQLLRYRNPLECVTYLFQNPSFKDRMDFSPKWVYTADGKTRLYHEMASAEGWHAEQVHSY